MLFIFDVDFVRSPTAGRSIVASGGA